MDAFTYFELLIGSVVSTTAIAGFFLVAFAMAGWGLLLMNHSSLPDSIPDYIDDIVPILGNVCELNLKTPVPIDINLATWDGFSDYYTVEKEVYQKWFTTKKTKADEDDKKCEIVDYKFMTKVEGEFKYFTRDQLDNLARFGDTTGNMYISRKNARADVAVYLQAKNLEGDMARKRMSIEVVGSATPGDMFFEIVEVQPRFDNFPGEETDRIKPYYQNDDLGGPSLMLLQSKYVKDMKTPTKTWVDAQTNSGLFHLKGIRY